MGRKEGCTKRLRNKVEKRIGGVYGKEGWRDRKKGVKLMERKGKEQEGWKEVKMTWRVERKKRGRRRGENEK